MVYLALRKESRMSCLFVFIIVFAYLINSVATFQFGRLGKLLTTRKVHSRVSCLNKWTVVDDFNAGNYKNTSLMTILNSSEVETEGSSPVRSSINLYRLEASLPRSEVKIYLNQYKEEMKKRRAIIPGK